jgi:tight adherence protein C
MSSPEVIAPLLIGLLVGLLAWVAWSAMFSEERRVARRLRAMSEAERDQAAEIELLATPFNDRILRTLWSKAAAGVRALMPSAYLERLAGKIRLSGPHRRLNAELFILLKVGLAVVGLVVGLSVSASTAAFLRIAEVAVFACVGYFGPDVWLSGRVASRQKAIQVALPDMLDMLMVSVEAGLGFDAALMKVVSSTEGPLSQEFGILLQEIQAGAPRRDAMQHLAARTEIPALSAFIMAIVQADTFGVSIANTLRMQSKEMRTRRRQRAEELAQKAQAKLIFPLMLCILPATLIVVGGPAIIRIIQAFSTF